MSGGLAIDLVLLALLLGYAASGYRQGLVVSVLSLVGFLGGGALGMAVLPTLFAGWGWAGEHVLPSRLLLVGLVFFLASLGQSIAMTTGRRLRRHLRARPAVALDSVLGALASLLAVAVLTWFVAGGLRGVTSGSFARAIGDSRVLQAIDTVVPAETGRLFAGFRQVLDQGGRAGNYLEASASCMYVYAFCKGVRMGLLPSSYRARAERGYQGILDRLIRVDEQGLVNLEHICGACGLGGVPYRDGSYAYYVTEKQVTNDYKGVGSFVLASLEIENKE